MTDGGRGGVREPWQSLQLYRYHRGPRTPNDGRALGRGASCSPSPWTARTGSSPTSVGDAGEAGSRHALFQSWNVTPRLLLTVGLETAARRRSGRPIERRNLDAETVRISHEEVVGGVSLHRADARGADRGSHPVGVERVHADTDVINPSAVLALLQDDDPAAREIEAVVVRTLDDSRRREPEQAAIERLGSRTIGDPTFT